MAEQILGDAQQREAIECLYAIEAISQLMQKASVDVSEATEGVYGSAVVIERNARRLIEILGD